MIKILVLILLLVTLGSCSSVSKEVRQYRVEYKKDFLTDPRSPLKMEDLDNLKFFPPSAKAKVIAKFKLTPDEQEFEMATYSGLTRRYRKWGEASFFWGNTSARLSIYDNLSLASKPEYSDYLFLPFKDETNGVTTYGGGRYINMSKADTEDGEITIDFNKCYNPWCAYSDGFNCPIPPKENNLAFPVKAGEKNYKGIYVALGH